MGVANISGNILTDSGASLSSYLPLTGGTLTGALNGTSATFSGEIKSGDTITLGTSAVGGFWTWGASNSYLVAGSGKALNLNPNGVSGNIGIVIATSGNVGIGTSNPQMPLTIQANTGNGAIRLIGTSNASSNNAGIYWYDSNDSTFNGYLGNFSTSFDIYNQRSTSMVFYTAGTERMRINQNGDIRIGDITGADGRVMIKTSSAVGYAPSGYNGTNANIRLMSGGSPTTNTTTGISFGIGGSAEAYIGAVQNSSSYADIVFQNYDGAYRERMRITSDGAVLVGASSTPSSSVSGVVLQNPRLLGPTLFSSGNVSDSRSFVQFINANGVVGQITTSGTSTSYVTSSDYRLKQDLKDYNGLHLVSAIKTYDYEWKSDNTRSYGVLAHELEEVIPQAVYGEKDGEEMQGVDYSKLVPVLVKAIQELSAKVTALENK